MTLLGRLSLGLIIAVSVIFFVVTFTPQPEYTPKVTVGPISVTETVTNTSGLPDGYTIVSNGKGDYRWSKGGHMSFKEYGSYDGAVESAISYHIYELERKAHKEEVWTEVK